MIHANVTVLEIILANILRDKYAASVTKAKKIRAWEKLWNQLAN